MPSSAGQLLALVALLLPGLAFVQHRERHRPNPKMSAFRESATVVFASVIVDLVVILVVLILVSWLPSLALDLPSALRPSDLTAPELLALTWRGLSVLALAVGLGWVSGSGRVQAMASRFGLTRKGSSAGSAWWVLFRDPPRGTRSFVGIELANGDWLEGYIRTWSDATEESADRELTIEPTLHRVEGASCEAPQDGVASICVSARHINFMRVSYINIDT